MNRAPTRRHSFTALAIWLRFDPNAASWRISAGSARWRGLVPAATGRGYMGLLVGIHLGSQPVGEGQPSSLAPWRHLARVAGSRRRLAVVVFSSGFVMGSQAA